MTKYIPPASVFFVWHPNDAKKVTPIINDCIGKLSRHPNAPFSRSVDIPIFIRTGDAKNLEKIRKSSKKVVAFYFLSKEVVADDEWHEFVRKEFSRNDISSIPIALDEQALNIDHKKKNGIRFAHDNDETLKKEAPMLILHEIYRWLLNASVKRGKGKERSLKLFLSHTKQSHNVGEESNGQKGFILAKSLKDVIDNGPMKSFFDMYDIEVGREFDEDMLANIADSTFLAIQCDEYSSRYWCQLEFMHAKERSIPIVIVDISSDFEDRRFPYSSNVPCVYVDFKSHPDHSDVLRILEACLIETIRFNYSRLQLEEYKKVGWIDSDFFIMSRPPEAIDIPHLLKSNHRKVVYPDPPVYAEERKLFDSFKIDIRTPFNFSQQHLKKVKIGASISTPSIESLILNGQTETNLTCLLEQVTKQILSRGSTFVFGGDLRENGYTRRMFEEAKIARNRMNLKEKNIEIYIAWPRYCGADFTTIKADNTKVAEIKTCPPPGNVKKYINNLGEPLLEGDENYRLVNSECLTKMREIITGHCDARICVGGMHSGFSGLMPGILEEVYLSIKNGKPLYLLGGFGGLTKSICEMISNKTVPKELTMEWQMENNEGYSELMEKRMVDYDEITSTIMSYDFKNGLSLEDNEALFKTQFVDEAIYLIFKGMNALYGGQT